MKIDHIVFDIGSVLIHWDREIPFRQLIPDDSERQWFLENVCTLDWNLEQDRGRPWKEAEDLLIDAHPEHADNIRAFRQHWIEMVPHHHETTVDLLSGWVKEGRDVTLLTNFAADTFREAQARFEFLTRTRGATVSGEIGLIKPDPAIFHHHAASFDLHPGRTLFHR